VTPVNVCCLELSRIVTDYTPNYVEFVTETGGKFCIKADSKHDRGFEFIPPRSAWHNVEDGIPLLVQRVPARQFLRGICDRNIQISDLNQGLYPVDFSTLAKLYSEKMDISTALAQMEKAMKDKAAAGIAISEQFAISIAYSRIKCFNATIGRCTYKDEDLYSDS